MDFDALPICKQKWIYSMIFLQVPKTGTSSLNSIIGERNLVWKHRGLFQKKYGKSPLYRGIFNTRHCSPEEIFSIFNRQVFDYFSFAVSRHPFQRLVSSYFFGKKNKFHTLYSLPEDCSFEQYISFLHENWELGSENILILKPQTSWTHSKTFRPNVILKQESLESDWQEMLEEYKIKGFPKELPRLNKTEHLNWQEYFTPEIKKKALDFCGEDFRLLSYNT